MEWSIPQPLDKEGTYPITVPNGENGFTIGELAKKIPYIPMIGYPSIVPIHSVVITQNLGGLATIFQDGFMTYSKNLKMRVHNYIHAWIIFYQSINLVKLMMYLLYFIRTSLALLALLVLNNGYLILEPAATAAMISQCSQVCPKIYHSNVLKSQMASSPTSLGLERLSLVYWTTNRIQLSNWSSTTFSIFQRYLSTSFQADAYGTTVALNPHLPMYVILPSKMAPQFHLKDRANYITVLPSPITIADQHLPNLWPHSLMTSTCPVCPIMILFLRHPMRQKSRLTSCMPDSDIVVLTEPRMQSLAPLASLKYLISENNYNHIANHADLVVPVNILSFMETTLIDLGLLENVSIATYAVNSRSVLLATSNIYFPLLMQQQAFLKYTFCSRRVLMKSNHILKSSMSRERACRVMGALSRLQSQRAPEGGPRGRVFSVFSYETILVLDCFASLPPDCVC